MDIARKTALEVLYKLEKEEAYSNIELNRIVKENKKVLEARDISLISELVYGVTNWRLTLDEIIMKYSKIKIKKISIMIKNILRMGVYQIIFLDKIPKSAAVNESVELAKKYGHKASANFVNAILRKVSKQDYDNLSFIEDNKERLSKMYSMPMWMVEKILNEKTIEEVEEIFQSINKKMKINIRINKLKTNKIELTEKLKEKGIEVSEGILDDYLYVEKIGTIEKNELFQKGLFIIQDEVAGLPSLLLEPKENEKILDACAAPGGKTTYIAQLVNNNAKIEAWDIYEHRIELINQNAKRLGIECIETLKKDANILYEEKKEYYDKILLDVPCMGTGVINRKPDIKWQKHEEKLEELNKIQYNILEKCSKYLKKGGTLIYSTCSILKEENDNIIMKFLNKNKEFQIEKINLDRNEIFNKYIAQNGFLSIYPNKYTNGFFIAKIQKKI